MDQTLFKPAQPIVPDVRRGKVRSNQFDDIFEDGCASLYITIKARQARNNIAEKT
ncbi:hypothetical protein [Rhizobium rhizogenes]|uniref:hypothetical protein n=1 Tax=Rhizobium rhizogenes TaxID=359 RepID=UPI001F1E1276|nr:hypothetical protein [Rhizobium rhizogenes]WEO69009.1 hypothetical protein G6L54_022555 [Rhizobium rhizogenes]